MLRRIPIWRKNNADWTSWCSQNISPNPCDLKSFILLQRYVIQTRGSPWRGDQYERDWRPLEILCQCKRRSGLRLSHREIIECRYIGLFSISKSISYRTSHIEYLDILKTNDFFVFFRRKFQKFSENSENSPKIQKTHEPKSSTTTTAPKIPKIRRKFWKFAENSSKRRSSLRPSYRIVSYRIEKKPSYRIDIVSSRKKAYRYWMV